MYYGPSEGISVYLNGSHVDSNFVGDPVSFGESNGNVILGREYLAQNFRYADVIVDELLFWNQPLGAAVIQKIYNSYN